MKKDEAGTNAVLLKQFCDADLLQMVRQVSRTLARPKWNKVWESLQTAPATAPLS